MLLEAMLAQKWSGLKKIHNGQNNRKLKNFFFSPTQDAKLTFDLSSPPGSQLSLTVPRSERSSVPEWGTWRWAGRPCWCWAGRSAGGAEGSRPAGPRCPWAGRWRTASFGACSPAWRTGPRRMDLDGKRRRDRRMRGTNRQIPESSRSKRVIYCKRSRQQEASYPENLFWKIHHLWCHRGHKFQVSHKICCLCSKTTEYWSLSSDVESQTKHQILQKN